MKTKTIEITAQVNGDFALTIGVHVARELQSCRQNTNTHERISLRNCVCWLCRSIEFCYADQQVFV